MSSVTALVLTGLIGSAPVDQPAVSIDLQVELLSKVLRYDRSIVGRTGAESQHPERYRLARWLRGRRAEWV